MVNVLFVEDEKMAAWVSKKNLEQLKHTVDIAETAKEAVEKFQAGKYDIIFMDGGLPEGSEAGVMVIQQIRAYEEANQLDAVPIVGVSANAAGDMEKKMLEAGANGYYTKPVIKDTFENIINKYLVPRVDHGLTK